MENNKLICVGSKEYNRVHDWLRKINPKNGECEHCREHKKLENALKHGCNHEKNVENYLSLCRKCHIKYDHPNGIPISEDGKERRRQAVIKRIKTTGVNPNFINSKKGKKNSELQKQTMSNLMRGENHHSKKLTEQQVIEILKDTISKNIDLAKKYDVTPENISSIKRRKSWKHLDY